MILANFNKLLVREHELMERAIGLLFSCVFSLLLIQAIKKILIKMTLYVVASKRE
jgi:hypothetical protein